MNFTTEGGHDFLTINGHRYSGSGHNVKGASGVLWSNISCESDGSYSDKGWRICVEKLPSCSDGLELVPVAIPDCPPGGEDLPNCHDAAPGELCEFDGSCGTIKDINICSDKFRTYPASRDVYHKANTTANTVTVTTTMTTAIRATRTATTMTKTSTTSTTTPLALRSAGEDWIVGGPCTVRGKCLLSPNYPALYGPNESCVASLPIFSAIRLHDFKTEEYFDSLTINGYTYSGLGLKGTSTVLWSNISWTSDGWNNMSLLDHRIQLGGRIPPRWKICI